MPVAPSPTDAARRVVLIARARRLAESGRGREVRLRFGLSLRDIAVGADTTVTTLSRWERGQNVPRGDAAIRWLQILEQIEREAGHDVA